MNNCWSPALVTDDEGRSQSQGKDEVLLMPNVHSTHHPGAAAVASLRRFSVQQMRVLCARQLMPLAPERVPRVVISNSAEGRTYASEQQQAAPVSKVQAGHANVRQYVLAGMD